MTRILFSIAILGLSTPLFSQDSILKISTQSDVLVRTYQIMKQLPDSTYNMKIVSGKKMEIISLNALQLDLSTNNYRQLFKRTPGIYVSEHDASGLQTSISTRGLSANRSWEFNMRQNGYDIAADPSGYPESYYTPTLDAVSKVEVHRGSSALQYGTQFGGMINYQFKDKLTDQPFSLENSQTIGSFGLFNSFTAIGGNVKKWSYYGFVHHRNADGFRQNSQYSTANYFGKVSYQLKKGKVSAEYSNSGYVSQQAGGIFDTLLHSNPDTSFRARNWFQVKWNTLSIQGDYSFNEHSKIQFYTAFTFSDRNSVGFTKSLTVMDTINSNLGSYNPRQVDIDHYLTQSSEVRYLKQYKLGQQLQTWTLGARFCNSEIQRLQQGIGNTSSNLDLSVTPDNSGYLFQKDLVLGTQNVALFSEHLFKVGKRLSFTPGFRSEYLLNQLSGRSNNFTSGIMEIQEKKRFILLGGLSTQFQLYEKQRMKWSLYANATQNYRPVMYSELLPSSTTEVVDQAMEDVTGFTSEIGTKGVFMDRKGPITFDINTFYLRYNGKIGTYLVNNAPFKTNIGDVVSKGMEAYVEWSFFNPFFKNSAKSELLSIYVSGTIQDATYVTWNNPQIAQDPTHSIEGKKVEYAPSQILRAGINYDYKGFSFNYQYSYTGSVFTDAVNTVLANATAAVGQLSAYDIHDVSVGYKLNKNYQVKIGANNLLNETYATRRSGGYPGPGLLPSQGRSIYGTMIIKL
ncbi:MAG: TonB-dependent receptor [Crocinitomicaceae bacterium]|nr:TonB-dependent receptor [Crocinitomicaceae bacterium]